MLMMGGLGAGMDADSFFFSCGYCWKTRCSPDGWMWCSFGFMYRCRRIPCRHVELTSSLATGSMNRISFLVQICYLHSVRTYMNFTKFLFMVSSSRRESCLTEPRPYHPTEQDRKDFSCL